jgi:hypothetical protein
VKVFRILTLLILVSRLLPAQSSAPPLATGSITGHVVLGDSHLPARMAYVVLLPVGAADAGDKKPVASTAIVGTGLDGSFVIPNVLPGAYYVAAMKLGYASPVPVSLINGDDYGPNPQDVKDALAAALTPVVVAVNRISTTEIVLNKGAVISGSVRFDDGEPYSKTTVSLLRKDKSGKWADFGTPEGLGSNGAPTDDQGNFRLTGLPAGEYLLRTTLRMEGGLVTTPGVDSPNQPDYRWDIYFGDGIRPRDGKIIKLKEGEQSNGNTIEIPLARLHSISGTVLSEETGAPINQADVELHNADDDSTCTVTAINSATGQFRFPYVAEGEYTLKVRKAADVAPGSRSHDEKPLRTYAEASQPLIVKGETNGITIQVKPQPAAARTAQ